MQCGGYSAPDSRSGGTGFDPWQHPIMPGLTIVQAFQPFEVGKLDEKSFIRPCRGVERGAAVSAVPFIILPLYGVSVVKRALALVISDVRFAIEKSEL